MGVSRKQEIYREFLQFDLPYLRGVRYFTLVSLGTPPSVVCRSRVPPQHLRDHP